MINILIIFLAVALLAGLLYLEKSVSRNAKLTTKAMLSCLFIIAAVVQPRPLSGYFPILATGLLLCLAGDVFLALPMERMFLFGLVAFLLGHLFFIGSFFYIADLNRNTWIGAILGLIAGGGVFLWLRSGLGSLLMPVVAYIAVITLMLTGAWTVLGDSDIASGGRLAIFFGALSFYISDLFVARDRFLAPEFKNRLIGLPLYYTGQFLLAFSVGLVG